MNVPLLTIFLGLSCAVLPALAELPPGCILELDAREQPELRRKSAMLPSQDGSPVERWLDAGGAVWATQSAGAARPVLRQNNDAAFLRFDGVDDVMTITGPRRLVPELTAIILAAPRSNKGTFRGFFSTGEAGKNDFTSGINLDMGPEPTTGLTVLNVESAGCQGFADLLQPGKNLVADLDFASFHVFTVRSRLGPQGNELFLDGLRLTPRARLESHIGLDEMVLGGRYYSHDPGQPAFAQAGFHGDIAAVYLFDRALPDKERTALESLLLERAPALNALAAGTTGHSLAVLKDAPPVQMLAPGFTVRELPVKLTNRNNLRYRHDGKLVALGYNGHIHVLSDTDGDGLEDHAEPFWEKDTLRGPLGIALTASNDPRGDGVFVTSKGKVSLILDRDRDGRAEEEIIVATGWKEIPQNVDAVGLAVDPADGSLYFGLGAANYANGYLIDAATGKAAYDLRSERGTIQKVSADFKTRTTICTGVRFTCALAFNKEGDLFATEQEGATWLPNGNPLDELLHIQPGKHYGFPPRHPVHLPDVTDWPAVVEYGPQHQSAVGMVFNYGVNGGPHFGPESWAGSALVCGEARGKIWRTSLEKTAAGYTGENTLIACLGLLTVDCCVSPAGDLLVACHSGPPDWGTGPGGDGRIFQIRYANKTAPQPLHAWASAPDEFRIRFDRPLEPADWTGVREKIRIEAGAHVSAGDRYEVIAPGYQVVRNQMASPRRDVAVLGLSLTEENHTLALKVPRQTEAVGYAVTLPVPASWRAADGSIPQRPEMEVLVTQNPPAESRADASMKIDTTNPFQPAVQPGATLDWKPAPAAAVVSADRRSYQSRGHTLPIFPSRIWNPWVTAADAGNAAPVPVPGNWLAGRRVFFSDEAACSTCHQLRGEGIAVGPDLGNLIYRDRESVLTDILQPSAAINPDHPASMVKLKNGQSLTGIVRKADDKSVSVALQAGAVQMLARADVAEIEPLRTSLMPGDYATRLTADQQRDLLAFLLTNPLEPAPILRKEPATPPARTRTELASVLAAGATPAPETPVRPLRILLSAGPKDHGPGEHDYPLWQKRWAILLGMAEGVTVDTAWEFPSADQLAKADVTVFFSKNQGWNPQAAALMDAYQERGGGLVYIHWAIEGGGHIEELTERIGLATRQGETKYRHGEFDLVFPVADHPVTRGFPTLHFTDETYWGLKGDVSRIQVLGHAVEDGAPQPELWSMERKKGRVIGCIPGHYTWTFDDPLFRVLVLRSICWTAREPHTDRLSPLATPGARLAP